ncbi:hypothetical protein T8K17_24105 [Thalassobaculum sp. OXR-137]|uniref:hypothetical protein n=1 Tax=Thalassobaculum sp. OXR-137 TaxID=3100173 RepID=UPI002AC8CE0D|nr:hypothetical protein [Thalassobaculum sp. OXR-137]WPZ34302.1 hypothetical protein T8K17_24105 [Thalassobaculum sp. OXR-137]
MKITRRDFDLAVDQTGLSAEQGSDLWRHMEASRQGAPFTAVNVLFYAGALIVIAAMTLYVGQSWETFSGLSIAVIGFLYGAVFLIAGDLLTRRAGMTVPGGLCVTVALAMVPMIVYGAQVEAGLWPDAEPGEYGDFTRYIQGGWFVMEVATLAAGAVLLRLYRFPFLVFVIGMVLWFMSMDIAPLLVEERSDYFEIRRAVSMVFGIPVLLVAYWADLSFRKDYAFWLYLFGMLAFWGGLSLSEAETELARLLYCLLNVGLIALSVFLRRRVFMVFGVIGVMGYLGYLAFRLFEDSAWFPFALSGIGILVLLAGYAALKNRERLTGQVEAAIPPGLRRLRPDRA